jgi:2-methylcitrate dehydratase
MDYNDIYWKQDPSHPSDIFPAAMACLRARQRWQGVDRWIGAGPRIRDAPVRGGFPGIRERGWHHATLTAFVSPIVAGARCT